MARYGYDVKPDMTPREQRRVIMAFQMHFRPTLYNGEADAETQAIAEALLEKYGRISAAVFRGRVARRQFSRYLHPG
ncbi:putative N-acetylmuramoyl-L-alanine amidase [Escherichia coli]|uniref:Putative N-acetylmuramoyl-L-alanine amidase n=1 Tax=Escherichia coli TaxID=562 RepID=A0A376TJD0_ECOLX|nr:putative N-acetylmuramoyl-L-alanine amidase [Escherichia coli]